MKISLIGPGFMFIPPTGWGAVESLIWDYSQELGKLGHQVQIINTTNRQEIIREINAFRPDFVHLHFDEYTDVLSSIECAKKAATSHFAYIEQVSKHGAYQSTFNKFINGDFIIFCLSENIKNTYLKAGVSEKRLKVLGNGAKEDDFRFIENPLLPDKSIYLARICERKRQHVYQNIKNVDFAGNINGTNFKRDAENYIGHWSKKKLYSELTNYANLILLSDGEADPLVTKEGLMAGLGLVISEYSIANLDLSKPFIDVVPNEKLNDLQYIENVIENNRTKSIPLRNEIRKYAVDNFSWTKISKQYLNLINTL